ncbi:HNH endonuclease [Aquibaculum sediminis]|uniref:HNH endonuclease n=1 Tax=Aquibaculum sediminis TaxID=3231907 RepID=UPI0034521315
MLKLWVANTDFDWFDYLYQFPNVDEVNFWQPSGKFNFRAVEAGDLFLFKLKSPHNAIGGYGVFAEASILPVSLAWEAFGYKNGVASYSEMRQRIGRFRKDTDPRRDYSIGCRIVVNPVFFPENLWIPQPSSWSNSIVVGKIFDASEPDGLELWDALQAASASLHPLKKEMDDAPLAYNFGESHFGTPVRIAPRLGQGAFRVAVIEAYGRECALSGGRVLPALDAAHIRAFGEGGNHALNNGILLRKDIHSVFDAGYATFDDDLRMVVSDRVKSEFNNGNEYLRLKGHKLRIPKSSSLRPSLENIRWHQDNVFLG